MAAHTSRRGDVDLLVRSTEELLLVATDETRLLALATALLGERYGYGARYVLLHDDVTGELHHGGAAGPEADSAAVRDYRVRDHVGLAGACWTTRQVVNAPDVHADPRYVNVIPSCRSEICVPIVAGESCLGVLSVESDQRAAFGPEDERLLSAYARVVALGLVHARLHAARQRDIRELQAIGEIARRAASLDLAATLDAACEALRRLTTSDSVALYLWDPRVERLHAAALSYDDAAFGPDYPRIVLETPVALGEGITGWVGQHRTPVRIDDAGNDARVRSLAGVAAAGKSAIAVPLVVEERLIGVIRGVKVGVAAYTDEHLRFALTLASQIAVAVAAAQAHDEVRRLSVTDELTGAHNARHVMQRLREELEEARRHDECVALLVIDGDGMKHVNDAHGHAEGNRLLVSMTAAIRQMLRLSDVLGRYGGDEFVVVLPHTCRDEAVATAERLRVAVATNETPTAWGERIRATVSIGLATFPSDGTSADDLFRAADRALYEAKQGGRNRVGVAGA